MYFRRVWFSGTAKEGDLERKVDRREAKAGLEEPWASWKDSRPRKVSLSSSCRSGLWEPPAGRCMEGRVEDMSSSSSERSSSKWALLFLPCVVPAVPWPSPGRVCIRNGLGDGRRGCD